MTPPGTFDRVYAEIKQRLRQGVYRPGDRMEPGALADELNASVTPVRDALHRLTGERLVEAPRHEGFRAPVLSEPLLRQLYAWHYDLLLLALVKNRGRAHAKQLLVEQATAEAVDAARYGPPFAALVQSVTNVELRAALDTIADRIEPLRRLESRLLDGTEAETREIVAALRAGDKMTLRRSLARYHRRRQKIVPDLLQALLGA